MLIAPVLPSRGAIAKLEERLDLPDVSFRYPKAKSVALANVTLRIPRDGTVGFIGGSGAGKSTLVDVILGLLRPWKGQLKWTARMLLKTCVRGKIRSVMYRNTSS